MAPRKAAKPTARKPARAAKPARRKSPKQTDTTVAGAVERDLAGIAKRDPALAKSTLAMSALRLAREMDSGGNSATSKSMCAKTLLDTMERLQELAPTEEKPDGLNDIEAQRTKRLARVAAAANRSRT